MDRTTMVFLGTEACIPAPGNDTASYLLNGEVLIDTGWHVTETLRRAGHTPADIKVLFFTHLHHDHIMGLPALLYERYCDNSAGKLHIYGPEGLPETIQNADRYIGKEIYWPEADAPQLHILHGGEEMQECGFAVRTMESEHTVPGFCYRMEDTRTGAVLGFTGDSTALPGFGEFFKDCDVLTHEFSLGVGSDPENRYKHSSIWDAAETAKKANVKLLCPVHGAQKHVEPSKEALRRHYEGAVLWAKPNEMLTFDKK